MKHIIGIAVAILSCIAFAQSQIIYNTRDLLFVASSGGSGCSHQSKYTQRVGVAQRIMFSFPTSSLNAATIQSVKLNLKPTACYGPNNIYVSIYTVDPTLKLNENNCSVNTEYNSLGKFTLNNNCNIQAADVTNYVKQAIQAGNDQVVFSISGGINDGVDFNSCQTQDDGSLGCGIEYNSRDSAQSSFYLEVSANGASSSAAPSSSTATPTTSAPSTAAPSTSAPSTSSAPSSTTSAPTSASCLAENVSGPNVASPARGIRTTPCSGNGVCQGQRCVCNAGFSGVECENAATTTTPPKDISGDNNAKSANSASSVTFMTSFVAILILFIISINM